VAKFLQAVGYRVYPVNPMVKQIDGQSCYPSLEAIPEPVDIVNVFRQGCLYPDRISAFISLKQNPTMGGVSGLI
jgi:predicted CoA-binding protein